MPLGSRMGLGVAEVLRPLRVQELGGSVDAACDGTLEPGAEVEVGPASVRGAKWEEEAVGLDMREE